MVVLSSSNTGIHNDKKKALNKYTQRQWDRTVGMGEVPIEYKETSQDDSTNNREGEELSERSR